MPSAPSEADAGLLRAGLLDGVSIVLAAPGPGAHGGGSHAEALPGEPIAATCGGLGARVLACAVADDDEEAVAVAVDRALAQTPGEVNLLVVDCAAVFARAVGASTQRDRGRRALSMCLQGSWNVTRALASRCFLPIGRGGRIVYIAPGAAGGEGEHARAARAGLENLSRTLSVEWARHQITAVTIAPPPRPAPPEPGLGGASSGASGAARAATAGGEVATLVADLASPAGAYFSGCLLELTAPAAQ